MHECAFEAIGVDSEARELKLDVRFPDVAWADCPSAAASVVIEHERLDDEAAAGLKVPRGVLEHGELGGKTALVEDVVEDESYDRKRPGDPGGYVIADLDVDLPPARLGP